MEIHFVHMKHFNISYRIGRVRHKYIDFHVLINEILFLFEGKKRTTEVILSAASL